MALEQVALLTSEGVDPSHIIIGHMDRKMELDYWMQVAETGVYLGIDQISKSKYYPDEARAGAIKAMIDQGHGHRLLLSGDLARRSYWPAYGYPGAPGFTYLLARFIPMLMAAGVSKEEKNALLVRNPAAALAMVD